MHLLLNLVGNTTKSAFFIKEADTQNKNYNENEVYRLSAFCNNFSLSWRSGLVQAAGKKQETSSLFW